MDIDLDIDNYSFEDLLKLFRLTYDFGEAELKKAYKIVLQTHPDKSGFDKEYFLFFSKAFKLLKSIYEYNSKADLGGKMKERNTKIVPPIYSASYDGNCVKRNRLQDMEKLDKEMKEKIQKFTKAKEFNEKFNDLFERVRLEDEEQDSGYGDWFKSNEDIHNIQASKTEMNEAFTKRKSQIRSLVKYNDIQDMLSQNGASLTREKPEEYSSELFGRLKYDDLKHTYTETVVPVTEEDFYNREQFQSVEQMRIYRKQNESLPDAYVTRQKLQDKYKREKQEDVQRAYKMMKQMENIENSHKTWMASFKQLTNM